MDKIPLVGVEEARFITGEDCQGNPESYWRSFYWFEGKCVGQVLGGTKKQVEREAREKLNAYMDEKLKSPEEQLRNLLKKGDLLSNDMNEAIRLLSKLVLKDNVPSKSESPVFSEYVPSVARPESV
jgi:hypothetical protein